MSYCGKCGQYSEGEGGIGCTCGKHACKGCGHFTSIKDGIYCWMCNGLAKLQAQKKAQAEFLDAVEVAIPALNKCISSSIQDLLKAWDEVAKFREEDRKLRDWGLGDGTKRVVKKQ